MDYQEKRNLKKSLQYAGMIIGAVGVILTIYHFLGFGTWSIIAFAIIAILGFSGQRIFRKQKRSSDIIDSEVVKSEK
jgi:membrane protein YdbS with pleckstrin-like domain